MSKAKSFILFSFLLFATLLSANKNAVLYDRADSLIYESYIKQFSSKKDSPIGQLLVETATYFSGKPYVASTLEINKTETLIINLREFDCTTLVENSMALSLTVKSGDFTFDNYCRQLKQIRYRGGEAHGYVSRLHYTNDWIHENENRGTLKNITLEIGGRRIKKPISFMTTHAHLYNHLKNNSQNIKELNKIEQEINARDNFAILPIPALVKNRDSIKDGDIIAFATSVVGLDYSHIGLAYWLDGELHFIHASSKMKKVVIEQKSLTSYCKDSKNCTGISILRLNN